MWEASLNQGLSRGEMTNESSDAESGKAASLESRTKRINIRVLHQSVWYLHTSHWCWLKAVCHWSRQEVSRAEDSAGKKTLTLKDSFSWRRSCSLQVQHAAQDFGHTFSIKFEFRESCLPYALRSSSSFFTPAGVNELILVLQFRSVCFRFCFLLNGGNNKNKLLFFREFNEGSSFDTPEAVTHQVN